MAAAGAAAPVVTGQQQLFASKHAELVSEARAMAREHGVAVRTIAFRPDGAGVVVHELIGRGERLRGMIGRAVARDVSAMGLREVAAHYRQLHALRAFVLGELQAKKTTAQAAAAAKDDDDVGATAKRALEKQETAGAGNADESNKIRRME